MRRIEGHPLWLGNAGDLWTPSALFDAGIRAIVDVAANEPFPQLPRDFIYCRFPLLDGDGNDPQVLRLAIRMTGQLIADAVPTLVACSNGLSRSPAIVAAALHETIPTSIEDALINVAATGKHDVSPALWRDVKRAVCRN
jgi:hypothetical protein